MHRLSTADTTTWLVAHDPLEVVGWDDPLVEQLGHAPRSAYVETYWLPVIGPASTWAMRRLTILLDAAPEGYSLPLAELGRELGLGAGTGRSSPVVRTLARIVAFGLATPRGDALAIRRMLAPLTCRQVRSLPEPLAIQHDRERAAGHEDSARRITVEVPSSLLCDTAPTSQVTGAVGDARAGDAGGTAVRSGKPAAAPPAPLPATATGSVSRSGNHQPVGGVSR